VQHEAQGEAHDIVLVCRVQLKQQKLALTQRLHPQALGKMMASLPHLQQLPLQLQEQLPQWLLVRAQQQNVLSLQM